MVASELLDEIQNGPLASELAPHVAAFDDQKVADALNRKSGAGAQAVQGRIPKGDFMDALLGAIAALATKDDATQKRYDRFLSVVLSLNDINVGNPGVQAILAAAVSDGLMTEEHRASIGTRTISRAEARWGQGTVVHHLDVAAALSPLRPARP
jgi:hypothetical protein